MDREFTGWVVPISNQLKSGIKLYDHGGHIPMPPLSFLIVQAAGHGEGTWLLESTLNFLFQAGALVLLFITLSKIAESSVAFISILGTVPLFFALPKTIVYDAVAQLFVALLFLFAVIFLERMTPDSERESRITKLPLVLGACCALILFSKQSTGFGSLVAVSLLIVTLRSKIKAKAMQLATLWFAAALFLVLLCLMSAPFISISGFFSDVVVHGSEPKGGATRMFRNLASYAFQLFRTFTFPPYVIAAALVTLAVFLGRQCQKRYCLNSKSVNSLSPATIGYTYVLGSLVGSVVALIIWMHCRVAVSSLSNTVLPALLLLALGYSASQQVSSWRKPTVCAKTLSLSYLFFPTLIVAVFHSLSVPQFRWSYDNNSLIAIVLAIFFALMFQFCRGFANCARGVQCGVMSGAAIIVASVQFVLWSALAPQLSAAVACTEVWSEVQHLQGARLPKSADGLREVVAVVRELAGPEDEVLLLPNDPNVAAWFERPSTNLSSFIIFTDQYRDRFVDADFSRLSLLPPKVIIIGPRNYWRGFSRIWNKDVGAERLIDRVLSELVPHAYDFHSTIPIRHGQEKDFMDIYVKRKS